MPDIKPNTNSILPDRLYGEHYPDSFLDVSQSLRSPRYGRVDDNDKYVREKRVQSDKPCIACEPSKSSQSTYDHICPNNPILTCNCTDPKYCAELGADPDGATDGNKICPDSGKVCNDRVCPNTCKGDSDGFADNIDYTGIPIPSPKREAAVSSWPCVVVGAVCETSNTAGECVSRSEHSAGDTERHPDARPESDGSYVSTNH